MLVSVFFKMNNKKSFDVIEIIVAIVATILAAIFIIQLLERIFGGSPTETELLYGGFSAMIVFFFGIIYRLGRFDQLFKHISYRLAKLEEGQKRLNEKFEDNQKRIEQILTAIERKLS